MSVHTSRNRHTPCLQIRPRAVGGALACAIAFLVVASLAGQVSKYELGHDHLLGLVRLFDVDGEGNIPTWYSAVTVLCAAALLGLIGGLRRREQDRFAYHWLGLSAVFLYVSLDEAAFIHELLNPVVARVVALPPYLAFGWVVVAIPIMLVLTIAYWQFFLALPRRTRFWFASSAAVFVGGAIGIEMVGSHYAVTYGAENLTYNLIATLEETMEMAGVAMFLYALLEHLAAVAGGLTLRFDEHRRG